MERAENKAQRLLQIERLLWAHPEGLTRAEIARRLDIHRSTITKYLGQDQLPSGVYEDELDGGKLKLDRGADLTRAAFNLHEIMALHLATRLLATRTDKLNPHSASALRKLARALQRLDHNVSQHLLRSADVMEDALVYRDPVYLQVLETLTEAWSAGRKVKVTHRHESGRIYEYIFAPYFLEPYAVGQTVHVIGWREPPHAIRTFKVERLRSAQILPERYEIPADFDPNALLRDAWGIWYSESEPVEVVLRFHPSVAARVKETQWQRGQRIEDVGDGSLIWRGQIAEPQEMLPWIRGWGADVEVMAPESLRRRLVQDAHRMGHLYHLATFQPSPVYYAHSKEGVDESEWQLLKEHLIATSVLAAELGTDAGVSELARAAGLLHDIGKYAQVFQERLRGSPQRVDHATAGAKEVMALFTSPSTQNQAELLSYCIAGHHSGLPNYGTLGDLETDGTLLARRVKKRLADYSVYKTELDVTALQLTSPRIKGSRFRGREKGYTYFSIAFLTRMIFSALVDADSLDTEQYTQEGAVQRGNYASLRELALEFDRHMQRFSNPRNAIHQKRTETLHACLARAEDSPGIFTLTVPTGGAKTLSSMAFALKHALAHGLKRILYVIPFTSIIEQNAAVFRTAFGSLGLANVLEHHSNLDWGRWTHEQEEDGSSVTEKLRLAGENWDIPVVVTTNVQFFESLFANKRQAARKLHRLAKSVIIFDEVQMLPREFMKPCILAISELVQNYGSSIVFSTATQPALQEFFDTQIKFTELAPDPPALFSFYRRVAVKDIGELSDEMLLERLRSHLQVLCVVNTRRHAAGLYRGLSGEGNFHLSTLMCPVHRQQTLLQIRQRLQEGLVCRVISTQVLEAGIDIDFPVGYRALAGLDSIIQAAGRVNREGRQESGEVWVFRPKTPFIKRIPRYIEQAAAVTQMILRDHDDPVSVEAIWSYYRQLYSLQDESGFDARRIVDCFEKKTGKLDFDFKTAAENFTLIDENTVALIVPYNSEVTALLAALTPAFSPALLRRLQPFTINLFEREFAVLQSQGVICTVHDRLHLLDQAAMQEYYHPETGLILPEESSGRSIFFD